MVLVLMRLFQKVLSAGKIPVGVKFIFDKPMRSFHIALIGLSPDGNGFMRRSKRNFNNFGKKCFFETIPWSSKLSTIVGLDCYFSWLDAIVLEMGEQPIDENGGTGRAVLLCVADK